MYAFLFSFTFVLDRLNSELTSNDYELFAQELRKIHMEDDHHNRLLYNRTIPQQDLTQYTNNKRGTITEIFNSLVTCQFQSLPAIGSLLVLDDPEKILVMEVIDHLNDTEVRALCLNECDYIGRNMKVIDTNSPRYIPIGEKLFGRSLNAFGYPIDDLGPVNAQEQPVNSTRVKKHRNIEKVPANIINTGVKLIDVMFPVLYGSKVAIVGQSANLGKAALLRKIYENTLSPHNERTSIYCGIGQSRFLHDIMRHGPLGHHLCNSVIILSQLSEPPKAKISTCETALAIAEHFTQHNNEVLLFVDNIHSYTESNAEVDGLMGKIPSTDHRRADLVSGYDQFQSRIGTDGEKGRMTLFQTIVLPENDPSHTSQLLSDMDIVIRFNKRVSHLGFTPSIDILHSSSRFIDRTVLGYVHYVTIQAAVTLLQDYGNILGKVGLNFELMTDKEKKIVGRANRLKNYFTQPLEFGTKFIQSQHAIEDVRAIVSGEHDDIPEPAFFMSGTVADIRQELETKML
jgi:F0F1-type ATP synthase beta subunit